MATILAFLHGFPDNHLVWKEQLAAFSDCTVLNFDLPGADDGVLRPKERYLPEKIAETIMTEIKDIRRPGDKVVLVGHDLGAVVLHRTAALHPDLVNGLVLLGGTGIEQFRSRRTNFEQLKKSWYILLFQLPGASPLIRKVFSDTLRKEAYRGSGLKQAEISELLSEAPFGTTPLPLYRTLLESKSIKRRLTVPTLFIFGKSDRYVLHPTPEEMEKFYVTAELQILDGGHWIQRQKAQKVNELIKTFLKKL